MVQTRQSRAQPVPLSVAPMMARTDRHYRYLMRTMTRHTLLYTEMVTTAAILHGDEERLIGFSAAERPLVLQLGGDDPTELARCARIAEQRDYDEVNLNIGCPSERVQKGSFGVCLMGRPERVAEAVTAMREATDLPVTVKHRIGFDEIDSYNDMYRFVTTVAEAGCDRFTVHARKAWLHGLSPKDNRNIPPLRYSDVHRLKAELPHLIVEINGGFRTLEDANQQLQHVDGVMIGRAAYDNPFLFAEADSTLFGQPNPIVDRHQVVEAMLPYIEEQLARGVRLHSMTRHMLMLFRGQPGGRRWRRILGESSVRAGAGVDVVERALAQVRRPGYARPIAAS